MTEASNEDLDAEVARLAALPLLAYERERDAAAKRLGVRVAVLDQAVSDKRDEAPAAAPSLILRNLEPWPQPVDGATLLASVAAAVRKYVVMEDHGAEAVALWALHAHALDAFAISPRLAITSAEKRCGKTTLLDVLRCLVPRPLPTANATAPSIFRTIELLKPTLLIDEADTFLTPNNELRGVLNSGHRKGGTVLRLVGDDHEPRHFSTWAATAIAMIGRLPDTLADRSIEICLRRKLASEHVARFRPDRATDLLRLARMAARWSADHFEALLCADPLIPAGLHDRAADNWEPLFAIADDAGGEWPERARNIAIIFSAREDEGGSHGELLLADIRETFDLIERGVVEIRLDDAGRIVDLDRIRSADLARILAGKEDRPWPEFGPRRLPINMHGVARLLKAFRISPKTLRFHKVERAGATVSVTDKGYERGQFQEAFARYLPPRRS
jgi:putative DNA primase/helicase